MMGRTHALSGLAVWAAVTIPLDIPPAGVIIGGVVCAGAAVLPDMDQHGSTVARTFGPLTRGFGWLVGKIAGGHRNGTHSALGIGLIAAVVFGASAVYTQDIVTLKIGAVITAIMVVTGLMFGLLDRTKKKRRQRAYRKTWHAFAAVSATAVGCMALAAACYRYGEDAGRVLIALVLILTFAGAIRPPKIKGWLDDAAPIPVAIALVWYHVDLSIVPYAAVLGVMVHIFGDMITHGGCPLGWPWSQTMRGPKLFTTGSKTENGILVPFLVVLFIFSFGVQIGPSISDNADRVRVWAADPHL
jgi:membrane-bound metal-dependent hydrolase YbcI (DUF457 family)